MRALICMVFTMLWYCEAMVYYDKLDRYIITCHTTDYVCFKRQYRSLRDNVLFGNEKLAIDNYKPYAVRYGNSSTCITITGLEESELVGIGLDSSTKEFTITLSTPFKLEQVGNQTTPCVEPDTEFKSLPEQKDAPKRFTGNATIQVSYPYELRKKKGEVHLGLAQEDVDVIVDVPDLSEHDASSESESRNYDMSEWAYDIVQHIDAATHFALPYTGRIRSVMEKLPLRRFIMLYPEEEYSELHFLLYDPV